MQDFRHGRPGFRPFVLSEDFGPKDRFFTPHPLTHSGGILVELGLPLLSGGAAVLMDTWEPGAALGLMAESGCSMIAAAPVFLSALTAEARKDAVSPPLPALRVVMSPGASGTHTRAEDPADR